MEPEEQFSEEEGGEEMEEDEQTNTMSMENVNQVETMTRPEFPQLTVQEMTPEGRVQLRKIVVPPHRMTPLRDNWLKIYTPIVTHLKLQIRMNTQLRAIELRTCPQTEDIGSLQKAADFIQAFLLGFEVDDAIALMRLDELFIDTFEVGDVKDLKGEHLSRAIGRVAGKDGKTKFTIENVTKTRIVLADKKIHILGSFTNIKIARDAICDLILGSPPGKVYAKLRTIAGRTKERF
jgi:RNA-binding protein PNO1